MLKNKNILIGVSSGIAIYKTLDLISRLKKEEANVRVIMTQNASKFISPHLFEIMSKSNVYLDQFDYGMDGEVSHINLAKKADVFLIAPATANTIAKISNGVADNLLTSTILAYTKPLLIAATMNTNMLNNPNTQRNINFLKKQGHKFIESNVGYLACDEIGDGRMAEPIEILDYIKYSLTEKDLAGKKIIVTAGPTVERIDPVRYISNDSSGKMGYAIAEAGRNRGADIILIAGPNNLAEIKWIKTIHIRSNDELEKSIDSYFSNSDALIMAAAPCDFKVKEEKFEKIKKDSIGPIDIEKNIDIVANFAKKKSKDQVIIGFAAETNNLIEQAKKKLKDKNLDYIVANDVSIEEIGFNSDYNAGYIISEDFTKEIDKMTKYQMANCILDVLNNE